MPYTAMGDAKDSKTQVAPKLSWSSFFGKAMESPRQARTLNRSRSDWTSEIPANSAWARALLKKGVDVVLLRLEKLLTRYPTQSSGALSYRRSPSTVADRDPGMLACHQWDPAQLA